MTNRVATSFCRICMGACGTRLTIDENERIVDIRGDKDQPMSKGYACFKGLQAEEAHHGPARLLNPLKRMPDGRYVQVSLKEALDEIAERLGVILKRDGGEAVGIYSGSGAIQSSATYSMMRDFLRAIGSPRMYTTTSIDQSAKLISFERLGGWTAGLQDFRNSDCVLLFGSNPVISHSTVGLMSTDPTRRLKRAKADGIKVICIDPRRTETSRYAEVFLQPFPGQDALIASAMIRIILDEGWHDKAFCDRWVGADRLAALRAAVDPFTPEFVEPRAGLQSGQIFEATAFFARDHKRGSAFTATGTNMARHSNLSQHMIDCINVICGRFRKAGDHIPLNPLEPPAPVHAQAISPPRSWESQKPGRIRGAASVYGEMMSATISDEILTPGEGQIRAMFIDGGNAANCLPDQNHVVEAFKALELLVVIDPYMNQTSQLAHFVLPPFMIYERADIPMSIPLPLFPDSWTQYTPAVLKPPAGSELIDDWQVYWEVASRLGIQISFDEKVDLDMKTPPTTDELLEIKMSDATISFEELKKYPSGLIVDHPFKTVLPELPDADGRFDPMPADIAAQVAGLVEEADGPRVARNGNPFTHLLTSRRMPEAFCSVGTMLQATLKRRPYNPAFINPGDMAELGLADGDPVEISSRFGTVVAQVEGDANLRRGCISLSHGWGGHPGESTGPGVSVNLLTSCREDVQDVNSMPLWSSLPVSLTRTNKTPEYA